MSAAFDMTSQDQSFDESPDPGSHYRAIASAIDLIVESYQDQPSLEDMAAAAGMSPFHFQRVFKRWAGISPKRFAQFVTLGHAKRLLDNDESVLGTALEVGLSGPSRLHDLFVACEAMTPGDYKARSRDADHTLGSARQPLRPCAAGGHPARAVLAELRDRRRRGSGDPDLRGGMGGRRSGPGRGGDGGNGRPRLRLRSEPRMSRSRWCFAAPTSRSRSGKRCCASRPGASSAIRTSPARSGGRKLRAPWGRPWDATRSA